MSVLTANQPTVLTAQPPTYSSHTRVQVAERLLIAGLRAQERADESEAARARLAFLFKASQRLALSLEPATVQQTLLDVMVQEAADAATLHIVEPGRRSAHITSATSDALAERSSEWWQWVERATGPSVKHALNRGTSKCGAASPRHSRMVPLDEPQVSYMAVPLRARGRSFGALRILSVAPRRKYGRDDLGLIEALASQASLALENAWLYQEQRALVAHLEDIHGQLDASQSEWLRDDERQRIARDLHDYVEQTFFAISLSATAAVDERRGELYVKDLVDALRHVAELSTSGAEQLRGAIFALKHADSSAFGLVSTLRTLARAFEERTGVETDLVLSGPESDLTTDLVEALQAIAREALANVERHAHATSVVVGLQMRPRSVTLTVQDDGVGAPNMVLDGIGSSVVHFGLAGLRERVRHLNGSFSAATDPTGGFVLRARLPLPRKAHT